MDDGLKFIYHTIDDIRVPATRKLYVNFAQRFPSIRKRDIQDGARLHDTYSLTPSSMRSKGLEGGIL